MNKHHIVIFITGVSGAGKTTIGKILSVTSKIPFFDADDYHPEANKHKMTTGVPLGDDDRREWLLCMNKLAKEQVAKNSCVIACSALKKSYRETLQSGIEKHVKWIFLDGNFDLLAKRLIARKGHFMPISLLQSQFDILEIPANAFHVSVNLTPHQINEAILDELDKSAFGMVGLGVMGKSLSRNIASKGFKLSVFNRHVPGKEENIAVDFQKEYPELADTMPFDQPETFIKSLQRPRKVFLMVNAGKSVDSVVEQFLPFLESGDIVMDGGNSHYSDTEKRIQTLAEKNIHFLGIGVSGGEEGALNGPAIMPGGSPEAYAYVSHILESIAAKDIFGQPCCGLVGEGGSGHFVKMVHNGMEYAEMQLLAEVYQLFKIGSGLQPDAIANLLESWKHTDANNYLLEITIDILRRKENDIYLLDEVLDIAGNKGTGNWTTVAACELGVPIPVLTAALFSRYISAFKEVRTAASEVFPIDDVPSIYMNAEMILQAYQLARLVNHHQGIHLLSVASKTYHWNLDLGEITRIWTNGCIIRSKLMEKLSGYLKTNEQLLLNAELKDFVNQSKGDLKELVQKAVEKNIPIPCHSEALNYLYAYSQFESGAALIQAQRDYFGAHLYQRKNDPSESWYHADWNPKRNS